MSNKEEGQEDDAFGVLVTLLASCTPDTYSPGKRSSCLQEATDCLTNSEECRDCLATSQKGLECLVSCHAYRRILFLYFISLGRYYNLASTTSTDDETAHAATAKQQATVNGLVKNLCRLLKAALEQFPSLKGEQIRKWKALLHPAKQSTAADADAPTSNTARGNLVADSFLALAKNDKTLWSTAILLGFDLVTPSSKSPEKHDWRSIFLEQAFGPTVTLPKQCEMEALQPFFNHVVVDENHGTWPSEWLSTLLLKTKANPEGGLGTLLGLVRVVVALGGPVQLPWQTEPEFLTVLTKQLQSAKDSMRDMAVQILATAPHDMASLVETVLSLLHTQVSKSTTLTGPQRWTLYELWTQLALKLLSQQQSWPIPNLDQQLPLVLVAISNLLAKEAKTATSAKEQAMTALWYWWRVAKRNKPNDGTTTLEPVYALLKKSLETKNNGTEVVAVVGHFLLTIVDEDAIEVMAMDLLSSSVSKAPLLDKGMDGIITTAMANAATSTTSGKKPTASVEGLIVVYLGLVHATAVGGSTHAFLTKAWKASPNFLLSEPMLDAVTSNNPTTAGLVRLLLPRVLALAAKWTGSCAEGAIPFKSGPVARALAACTAHPNSTIIINAGLTSGNNNNKKTRPISTSIATSIQTVLTYQPKVAPDLADMLWIHVNDLGNEFRALAEAFKRASQQEQEAATAEGVPSNYTGMDDNAVRRVAHQPLVKALVGSNKTTTSLKLAQVLTLLHIGTSLRVEGHQRNNLRRSILTVLKSLPEHYYDNDEFVSSLATHIAQYAALAQLPVEESTKEPIRISDTVHRAALSLMISLGSIASEFLVKEEMGEDEELTAEEKKEESGLKVSEFASKLCTKEIPRLLRNFVVIAREKVVELSADDVALMLSSPGTLHTKEPASIGSEGAAGKIKEAKRKGGMSKEDEEWEEQLKREIAEKKKRETGGYSGAKPLAAEDKKLVTQQDKERDRLIGIVYGDFNRALAAIRYLAMSDIEVGNACLPIVSEAVLVSAVSKCAAFEAIRQLGDNAFQVLVTLAASVFEIHEDNAYMLATALTISCRTKSNTKPTDEKEGIPSLVRKDSKHDDDSLLLISALPSPCESAVCALREMEEFHGPLSGNSFVFLFPIIRAALMGPRTSQGCDAALLVLERHTALLAGDDEDPVVSPLRKNMVVSVLELMKHDRAQTFLNPSPSEALVACFRTQADAAGGPALSTAELAPLLDDRGALGGKTCRSGAMVALCHIASEHEGLIKKNPLIENRIWLNCFDENEFIRLEARKAWKAIQGELEDDATDEEIMNIATGPSIMYAAPLLPLLNNPDMTIAKAAADAYAKGMAMHPKSVSKNIQKLCNSYIEAYPMASAGKKETAKFPAALPAKALAAPIKKPATSFGLPKKKSSSKQSALSVAGIGQPVKKKKINSALTSAMLKPKQERTLEQADLAIQFQAGPAQPKEESKDSPEKIAARLGILQAVAALTKAQDFQMDVKTLKMLTSFLMAYGIAESDDSVKSSARNSLRDVVASNGGSDEAIAFLLPHLEDVLKNGLVSDESALTSLSTEKIPKDVDSCDRRKEGAVVALGSVALHLKGPENGSKVDSTIDMLIATLKTPNEDVQASVAECLAKLMKKGNTQARIEEILTKLLLECLQGESLASRRGAAYGISAAVMGSGIATLKKYEIVKQLEEALSSGTANSKEGSLFAIELLSVRLGLLFEPYVIVLLPALLKAFSDTSDYVRKAASDTCGLIMSKLSAHGVKLVLPATLAAFNDPSWRTKQASIRMLGAMSHLAPKQLASALPKVVPKLTEAFSDTHPKVKSTAQEALDEISTVVKNPEISSISQLLLKALTDPADHTTKALEGLIATEFLHAIDAPSLALIVPIVHRGLRDRGAATKRYGALIAGNICTMINDSRDFVPYLPILLPDLKSTLLDPIPDVRSTSAKALGSLTRGLGDHILNDLRPWLIEKLGDGKCSSAERSGAANGLTQVLVAAGTNVIEDAMLQEILPLRDHPESSKREGVLWMLTFLPPTLGQGFTPLMDASLPALIAGLSDDSESVREVAMRAGRVLIRSHGKVHVDKILPSLEAGLVDDDYRIRLASLTLLGDLLSTIGGTTLLTGDGDTRDDIRRAERAQAQIALALGNDKRKRVLSGLYLARSDNTSVVRHHAIQVWKTVVPVTARALKDILPVLVGQVIAGLASGDAERTLVAGKCLGEIVTKLGDSVLPEIIPVLRKSLYEGDKNTKRGVCVGLTEVIECSTKDQILRYIEIIVKLVQDALCDEDEQVCQMAATSFQRFYSVVGSRALDEVVPSLMVALETSYDEQSRTRALNGLTGIMRVRSRDLLPYVVPRLLQKPVTKSHAEALSGIAKVTGETIHYHFHSIIPAYMNELANFHVSGVDDEGKEREEAMRECVRAICGSVHQAGVTAFVGEVASKCSHDKPEMRVESCWMFETALTERKWGLHHYIAKVSGGGKNSSIALSGRCCQGTKSMRVFYK
jgi:HEAT repeats/HEAT repeat